LFAHIKLLIILQRYIEPLGKGFKLDRSHE